MKKISEKKALLFFYAFDLILLVLALLALMPKGKSKGSVERSIVSKEMLPLVEKITLSKPDANGRESLEFSREKESSYWTGSDSFSAFHYRWPADNQAVEHLLSELTDLQLLEVKAKGKKYFKRLGLDESHSFVISLWAGDEKLLTTVSFGYDDLLTQKISLVIDQDENVYEGKASIKTYLKTIESFWSDPFVYPQCLTGYNRLESEKLLRHGELCILEPAENIQPDLVLKKDFENGSEAKFSLYAYNNEFVVIPVFKAGPAFSEKDKSLLEGLNYRYLLSEWTVNRLKEETK